MAKDDATVVISVNDAANPEFAAEDKMDEKAASEEEFDCSSVSVSSEGERKIAALDEKAKRLKAQFAEENRLAIESMDKIREEIKQSQEREDAITSDMQEMRQRQEEIKQDLRRLDEIAKTRERDEKQWKEKIDKKKKKIASRLEKVRADRLKYRQEIEAENENSGNQDHSAAKNATERQEDEKCKDPPAKGTKSSSNEDLANQILYEPHEVKEYSSVKQLEKKRKELRRLEKMEKKAIKREKLERRERKKIEKEKRKVARKLEKLRAKNSTVPKENLESTEGVNSQSAGVSSASQQGNIDELQNITDQTEQKNIQFTATSDGGKVEHDASNKACDQDTAEGHASLHLHEVLTNVTSEEKTALGNEHFDASEDTAKKPVLESDTSVPDVPELGPEEAETVKQRSFKFEKDNDPKACTDASVEEKIEEKPSSESVKEKSKVSNHSDEEQKRSFDDNQRDAGDAWDDVEVECLEKEDTLKDVSVELFSIEEELDIHPQNDLQGEGKNEEKHFLSHDWAAIPVGTEYDDEACSVQGEIVVDKQGANDGRAVMSQSHTTKDPASEQSVGEIIDDNSSDKEVSKGADKASVKLKDQPGLFVTKNSTLESGECLHAISRKMTQDEFHFEEETATKAHDYVQHDGGGEDFDDPMQDPIYEKICVDDQELSTRSKDKQSHDEDSIGSEVMEECAVNEYGDNIDMVLESDDEYGNDGPNVIPRSSPVINEPSPLVRKASGRFTPSGLKPLFYSPDVADCDAIFEHMDSSLQEVEENIQSEDSQVPSDENFSSLNYEEVVEHLDAISVKDKANSWNYGHDTSFNDLLRGMQEAILQECGAFTEEEEAGQVEVEIIYEEVSRRSSDTNSFAIVCEEASIQICDQEGLIEQDIEKDTNDMSIKKSFHSAKRLLTFVEHDDAEVPLKQASVDVCETRYDMELNKSKVKAGCDHLNELCDGIDEREMDFAEPPGTADESLSEGSPPLHATDLLALTAEVNDDRELPEVSEETVLMEPVAFPSTSLETLANSDNQKRSPRTTCDKQVYNSQKIAKTNFKEDDFIAEFDDFLDEVEEALEMEDNIQGTTAERVDVLSHSNTLREKGKLSIAEFDDFLDEVEEALKIKENIEGTTAERVDVLSHSNTLREKDKLSATLVEDNEEIQSSLGIVSKPLADLDASTIALEDDISADEQNRNFHSVTNITESLHDLLESNCPNGEREYVSKDATKDECTENPCGLNKDTNSCILLSPSHKENDGCGHLNELLNSIGEQVMDLAEPQSTTGESLSEGSFPLLAPPLLVSTSKDDDNSELREEPVAVPVEPVVFPLTNLEKLANSDHQRRFPRTTCGTSVYNLQTIAKNASKEDDFIAEFDDFLDEVEEDLERDENTGDTTAGRLDVHSHSNSVREKDKLSATIVEDNEEIESSQGKVSKPSADHDAKTIVLQDDISEDIDDRNLCLAANITEWCHDLLESACPSGKKEHVSKDAKTDESPEETSRINKDTKPFIKCSPSHEESHEGNDDSLAVTDGDTSDKHRHLSLSDDSKGAEDNQLDINSHPFTKTNKEFDSLGSFDDAIQSDICGGRDEATSEDNVCDVNKMFENNSEEKLLVGSDAKSFYQNQDVHNRDEVCDAAYGVGRPLVNTKVQGKSLSMDPCATYKATKELKKENKQNDENCSGQKMGCVVYSEHATNSSDVDGHLSQETAEYSDSKIQELHGKENNQASRSHYVTGAGDKPNNGGYVNDMVPSGSCGVTDEEEQSVFEAPHISNVNTEVSNENNDVQDKETTECDARPTLVVETSAPTLPQGRDDGVPFQSNNGSIDDNVLVVAEQVKPPSDQACAREIQHDKQAFKKDTDDDLSEGLDSWGSFYDVTPHTGHQDISLSKIDEKVFVVDEEFKPNFSRDELSALHRTTARESNCEGDNKTSASNVGTGGGDEVRVEAKMDQRLDVCPVDKPSTIFTQPPHAAHSCLSDEVKVKKSKPDEDEFIDDFDRFLDEVEEDIRIEESTSSSRSNQMSNKIVEENDDEPCAVVDVETLDVSFTSVTDVDSDNSLLSSCDEEVAAINDGVLQAISKEDEDPDSWDALDELVDRQLRNRDSYLQGAFVLDCGEDRESDERERSIAAVVNISEHLLHQELLSAFEAIIWDANEKSVLEEPNVVMSSPRSNRNSPISNKLVEENDYESGAAVDVETLDESFTIVTDVDSDESLVSSCDEEVAALNDEVLQAISVEDEDPDSWDALDDLVIRRFRNRDACFQDAFVLNNGEDRMSEERWRTQYERSIAAVVNISEHVLHEELLGAFETVICNVNKEDILDREQIDLCASSPRKKISSRNNDLNTQTNDTDVTEKETDVIDQGERATIADAIEELNKLHSKVASIREHLSGRTGTKVQRFSAKVEVDLVPVLLDSIRMLGGNIDDLDEGFKYVTEDSNKALRNREEDAEMEIVQLEKESAQILEESRKENAKLLFQITVIQGDIEAFKKRNEALQTELEATNADLKRLQLREEYKDRELTNLKKDFERKEKKWEEAEETLDYAVTEKQELLDDVEYLEDSLRERREINELLNARNDELNDTIKELKKAVIENKRHQYGHLREEVELLNGSLELCNHREKLLRGQVGALETEVSRYKNCEQTFKSNLKTLNDEKSSIISHLKEQLATAEIENTRMRADLSRVSDKDKMRSELKNENTRVIHQLEEQLTKLTEENSRLTTELSKALDKDNELAELKGNTSRVIKQLEHQLAELTKENSTLSTEISEKDQKIAVLRRENSSLNTELAKVSEKYHQLIGLRSETSSITNQKEDQLANLRKESSRLTTELSEASEKVKQLAELRKENSTLIMERSEILNKDKELCELRGETSRVIKQLEDRLVEFRKENSTLNRELFMVVEKNKQLTEIQDEKSRFAQQLEEKLAKLEKENSTLATELSKVAEKDKLLTELWKQVENLRNQTKYLRDEALEAKNRFGNELQSPREEVSEVLEESTRSRRSHSSKNSDIKMLRKRVRQNEQEIEFLGRFIRQGGLEYGERTRYNIDQDPKDETEESVHVNHLQENKQDQERKRQVEEMEKVIEDLEKSLRQTESDLEQAKDALTLKTERTDLLERLVEEKDMLLEKTSKRLNENEHKLKQTEGTVKVQLEGTRKLESQLQDMEKLRTTAITSAMSKQQELEEAYSNISKKDEKIDGLIHELKQERFEKECLKRAVEVTECNAAREKGLFEKTMAELKETTSSSLMHKEKELEHVYRSLNNKDAQINDLIKELKQERSDKDCLKKAIAVTECNAANSEKRLSERTTELEKQLQEMEELKEKTLTSLESEGQALEKAYAKVDDLRLELKREKSDKESLKRAVKVMNCNTKREKELLEKTRAERENQLRDMEKLQETTQRSLQSKEHELQQAYSKLSRKDVKINDLTNELKQERSENRGLREAMELLQSNARRQRILLDEKEKEVEGVNELLCDYEKKIENLNVNLQQTRKELELAEELKSYRRNDLGNQGISWRIQHDQLDVFPMRLGRNTDKSFREIGSLMGHVGERLKNLLQRQKELDASALLLKQKEAEMGPILDRLRGDLNQRDDEIESLKSSLGKTVNEVERTRSRLRDVEHENVEIKRCLEDEGDEVKKLELTVKKLEGDLQRAQSSLEERNKTLEESKGSLQLRGSLLASMEGKLCLRDHEIETLASANKERTFELERAEASLKEVKKELEISTSIMTKQTEEFVYLKSCAKRKTRDAEDMKFRVQPTQDELKLLSIQLECAKNEKANLSRDLAAAAARLENEQVMADRQKKALQEQVNSGLEDLKTKTKLICDMKMNLQESTARISRLEAEKLEQDRCFKDYKRKLARGVKRLKQSLNTANENESLLQSRIGSTGREMSELRQENQKLKIELLQKEFGESSQDGIQEDPLPGLFKVRHVSVCRNMFSSFMYFTPRKLSPVKR